MNTKLDWSTDFLAISICEERMYPNQYKCDLHLVTESDNPRHQNIAFERVKLFFLEILNECLFIGNNNKLLKHILEFSNEKIVILPEESYDQIIAAALFCKINSILEGVMKLEKIKLSSKAGDYVWYQFSEGERLGPFETVAKKQGKKRLSWWHRPDLATYEQKGKVKITWNDLGLGWEETDSEIIFTPEKTGEVIDMDIKKHSTNNFNVEIINGKDTDTCHDD